MKQTTKLKRETLLAAAVAATLFSAGSVRAAAVQQLYAGGTYTPNFSELPYSSAAETTPATDATNPDTLSSAFSAYPTSSIGSDFNGWSIYAASALKTSIGEPNTTTGAVFSFSSTSTNQALGAISTSTTGLEYFGVEIANATGASLTQCKVSFNDNLWVPGANKPLDFGYYVDNSNAASDTLSAIISSLTPDTNLKSNSLTATGTTAPFSASQSAIGSTQTTPLATESLSDTLSLTTPVSTSGAVWLVWSTDTSASKSQGIGINNLSFTTNVSGGGGGGGGGGGTTAQIDTYAVGAGSGAFDTSTVNFTTNGTPTKYTDGDAVVFPDTLNGGVGTVNVTAPSVSPASVTVSNDTGTYAIIGNPINGAGSLTKTGNGTLSLSPTTSNGYSGGTNINGGQVVIATDAALGAPSGAVAFNTGSLIVTSPITSARSLNFTGAGTLDTGANAATFASAGGAGAFTKVGTGNLTFTGSFSSGTLALQNSSLIFAGSITGANGSTGGGTVTLNPGSNGNALGGNVVLAGNIDLNVVGIGTATSAGPLGGSGSILVQASGSAITNAKASASTINSNIVLNSTGAAFTPGDVTQGPFVAGSFATVIGATTATTGMLTLNGTVSGNSDVVLANDPKTGGGSGVLVINSPATYHGTTVLNLNAGSVVSGVNNALPATTDVIIGGSDSYYTGAPAGTPGVDGLAGNTNTGTIGTAFMNLAGHNQQFSSISDGDNYVVGGTQSGSFSIINTSSTVSTFTISGSTSPANGFSAGIIGGGTTSNNINLIKGGSNYLVLNNTSTYTGSTTVRGGTLSIGSSQSSQLGLSESIASTNISLQGIDSHATLTLYSSTALANGASAAVAITTGGKGVEIDLDYSGIQIFNTLSINGAYVPNGIYSASAEPAADQTLFVGSGSVSVVPEPGVVGMVALMTPVLLRRRRRNASFRSAR